jgi:chemotaxis protein histidine kinase CheA
MSSTQETNVETVKVPRTKKPSLSGKYSKFLSFGFWFVNQFDGLEPAVRDAMFSRMKLFDTVQAQSEFFQAFLDDIKPSNKLMRAAITAHNKPPKAPKATKEPKEPKAKKTKGKSASETVEAHVDQLVADLAETAQAETAPKKTKKTKAAKTEPAQAEAETLQESGPESAADAEPVQEKAKKTKKATETVEAEKPAKKAGKKTKKTEPVPAQNEEVELETRIIRISDTQQFLIDNVNNLYDMESHAHVGFFDTNTNAAHLM